ncbi:cGMP-dependent 3',5'-cyclic phosphodiesterase-like isoform X2 [Symsagittifera roscoffensis]|uniref:cGMP-dependent 3',5'-cyclic phosphodiesterase-like isoform X2 n=1 Tax=Symsagittifera roscoffensis TaxID=84072 RepID=UPI00307B18CE
MASFIRKASLKLDKRLRLERTSSGHNVEAAKKGLEEGCLRLSEAISFEQFYDIISDTLRLILDNVSEVLVFCHDASIDKLVSTGSVNHPLPGYGICKQTKDLGLRKVFRILDAHDPLCQLLSLSNHFILPEGNKVLCSPIQDRHTKKTILFLVVICNELTHDSKENLDYLEKHIAATWYRLNQLQTPSVVASTSSELDYESKKILKLCGELYDRDGERLQQKLLHFLQEQLDCQHCILFFVGEDNSIFSHVTLPNRPKCELFFPISTNSFGTAIHKKCPVVLSDITAVEREQLEKCFGVELHNMLCMPVESRSDQSHVIALFCAFNKRRPAASAADSSNTNTPTNTITQNNNYSSSSSVPHTGTTSSVTSATGSAAVGSGASQTVAFADFDAMDEIKAHNTFRYTTTVLTSTIAYQKEKRLKTQTETMLNVAKNLFSQLEDMTELLKLVMQEARNLCNAERCSLFLVNENRQQLVAKVFDGGEATNEIRIPIDKGIAGQVATTGEILNIKDAYEHPLFFTGVDQKTGFRTRAILCFPIIDGDQVIGVAELCNKIAGNSFSTEDVEVAKAFSIYCAIAIAHSLLYRKVQQAQKKILLTNELMLYHMKNLSVDEVTALLSEERENVCEKWPGIDSFLFNARLTIPYCETVRCVLNMFHELGFISRWHLDMDTLVQFSLTVKQGYREGVSYHNWWHAFSVAHFFYLICKNSKHSVANQLSDLETFVTFIACLCHDIDHRGTNNSFEINSKSTLASLYSSQGSVMERHHFAQTVAILNSGSCNIFSSLPDNQFKGALDILQNNILATDLAHHFKIMGKLKEMAIHGYKVDDDKHHEMLLCLIMTSCDLSDQTKDWNNLIEVAESLYEEFFNQGDLEREMGAQPNEMMDRHRAHIPEQQISFLDNVAIPTFQLLSDFLPETQEALDEVHLNRRRWDVVKSEVGDRNIMVKGKLDIKHLDVDRLLREKESEAANNSSPDTHNAVDTHSGSESHNSTSNQNNNNTSQNCVANSKH